MGWGRTVPRLPAEAPAVREVVEQTGRRRVRGDFQDAWKEEASRAMDRYAAGDDAAFGELYDLLAPRLASFLSRRTRDDARTEDLVQQTFLQMHSARRHFAAGAAVTPWAFAIARRLLIDAVRKDHGATDATTARLRWRQGREEEAPSTPSPGALPDQVAARHRLTARIYEALQGMSEIDRVAFELVKCEGLSMAEAAEVLGTTENAVKLRAFRTYESLRATLGDEAREALEGSW
jgi:RNA polymerase sigma-70 factor (ECF subfamily)